MIRGDNRTEPLWWGRGSSTCLAIWPNKNGPYHAVWLGNDKTGQESDHMRLQNDELIDLAIFLLQVANGRVSENQ